MDELRGHDCGAVTVTGDVPLSEMKNNPLAFGPQCWLLAAPDWFNPIRVLPDDLYELVMETNDPVEKGAVFAEIVRRYGTPGHYKAAPKMDRS